MVQNRHNKGGLGSFTRGSELWWHQARLVVVALRTALLWSAFIGLCAGYLYVEWKGNSGDLVRLYDYGVAWFWESVGLPEAYTGLKMNGNHQSVRADVALTYLKPLMSGPNRLVWNTLVVCTTVALMVLLCMAVWLYVFGQQKMTDQHLRGSVLSSKEDLVAQLKANNDTSPYTLAGVPVRKGAETLHFLLAGAQGTGKSQQFFGLLDQIKARGKRAIIFDPSGEFTATYYREGKDVIMNPLDARSPHWTVWNDVCEEIHFDNIVNGLLPEPASGQADPFWIRAGRNVLKDTIKVLGRDNQRTNKALYESISLNGLQALNALLEGTPGATYTAPETERTGMSLKMTVQNQLECFRFLADEGEPFSIRKWIQDESDSWMFISTREAQMDAIRPLLSLWVHIAIQAVLDLQPIHRERLWFMLDEFPRLQKMDSMELALTNTRKYGLCMALGLQDFGQLREKFGANIAQTIVSQCQTKLILRISDGKAAKALAELIGQAEVEEKEENLSYGLDAQRDGVTVYGKRQLREMVLSSEILYLPDMTGYITTPGPYPIAKVSYGYKHREKIAPAFVPRTKPEDPYKRDAALKDNEGADSDYWIDEGTGKPLSGDEVETLVHSPNQARIAERGMWRDAI